MVCALSAAAPVLQSLTQHSSDELAIHCNASRDVTYTPSLKGLWAYQTPHLTTCPRTICPNMYKPCIGILHVNQTIGTTDLTVN